MTESAVIYGSGDTGTAELRSLALARAIPLQFKDIRTSDAAGEPRFFCELQAIPHRTVPVLITPRGMVLNDYDQARSWLMDQPAPAPGKTAA